MSNQIVQQDNVSVIESVVINGDLGKLSPDQRVNYYRSVCQSTGLNPLTKPFDYIQLSGKLTLYARKDATDQLRKIHNVSITRLEREIVNDVYTVIAHAKDMTGREDSSIGAVNVKNLQGDALANAMMKAETKSKRRVTLSICGLGWLDETEIETIHDASPVNVTETGEIKVKLDLDDQPPSKEAFEFWHTLEDKAIGLDVEIPDYKPSTITTGELRQLYLQIKTLVDAAEKAKPAEVPAEPIQLFETE